MKVFLSWSKPRSKLVAEALADWLPDVIPGVHPFMSEQSLRAGTFHHEALRREFKDSKYCVVCVTPENIREPWLNYEAGAIAERLDGCTCPYLFDDATFSDLGPTPLSRLQGRRANEEETFTLVQEIASGLPAEYQPKRLRRLFEAFWPRLDAKLKAIPKATETPEPAVKVDREAEVFQMIQGMREQQATMARQLAKLAALELSLVGMGSVGSAPWRKLAYATLSQDAARDASRVSLPTGPTLFVPDPAFPTFPKPPGGPDDGTDP